MVEMITRATRMRPMVKTDLALVRSWRNHPDIRRYMFTQHEITLDEHAHWFEQVCLNPLKHVLIFEMDGQAFGFVSLYETGPGGIAEWGFYAAPDAPKGTGRSMGLAALNHAFSHLSLHKVCGQAVAYNHRSIRFHQHLGFRQEGLLHDQHFDGEHYHDVLCFGLLGHEWKPNA
jgi:UDP-4-amino-4,6-dideoxy-N-acetyl-beta-L-altrosamine N-acetyltransferase